MTTKTVSASAIADAVDSWRMTFTPLDAPGAPLRLPYNPESYEIRVSPKWAAQNGAGAEFDGSDWEGNAPRVLNYDHLLTTQNVAGPPGGDVESVIQQFDVWASRPTVKTQQPTKLRVTAGEGFVFVGVVQSLSYRRVRTNAAGMALTAEFQVELLEVERGI